MLVTADLSNIPLTTLNFTGTCIDGDLLNFTNYCNFPQFINRSSSTLVGLFFQSWRVKFPPHFRNISNEELVGYLELARDSNGFYNDYVLPGLNECSRLDQIRDCFSQGTIDDISGCVNGVPASRIPKADCSLIQISGNPDIAGIGLFVAYVLMVATYTILTFAHMGTICVKKKIGTDSEILSKWRNVLNSVSLTFLDSTTFLSISILVAGQVHLKESKNNYETQFALAASSLTVTPLVTLTGFVYPITRRRRLKISIAAIAVILYIVQFFRTALALKQGLEADCSRLQTVVGADIATLITFAIYIFISLWALGSTTILPCILRRISREHKRHFMAFFLLPWGLSLTCANLAGVIAMRRFSSSHQNPDNQEDSWGYGQIVSLFVWAPVLVDLLYTSIYGGEKGQEGKLPTPFVVHQGDSNES